MMEDDRQPQSAVDWVIKNSKHKGSEYIVLVMLAKCIDGGNPCPSHKNLADMTRLKKPTVQHALGELEKDGTIASARNGGKTNNGGTTNCYAINGYVKPTPVVSEPTEVRHTLVLSDTPQVSENPVGSDTPQVGDTPLGETAPGQNAVAPAYTHARAAGEKELLKEFEKELKEFDIQQQTNSLNSPLEARASEWAMPGQVAPPLQNSGPVIGPAASTIEPETAFSAKFSSTKSMVPSSDPQHTVLPSKHSATDELLQTPPTPISAPPPPPPELLRLYFETFAYQATVKEQVATRWILDTYGLDFAKQQITGAKLVDGENKAIRNPMCYARTALEGEVKKAQAAVIVHSQTFNPTRRTTPDEIAPLMKFPGWGKSVPKGATT